MDTLILEFESRKSDEGNPNAKWVKNHISKKNLKWIKLSNKTVFALVL